MPFLRDCTNLALWVAGRFLVYLAGLGFRTHDLVIERNDPRTPYEFRTDLKPWRIRIHGWSRLTRIHQVREDRAQFLWL